VYFEIDFFAIHSNTLKQKPAVKEFKNVLAMKMINDQMLLAQGQCKEEFSRK